MKTQKKWSYQEITINAEKGIKALMQRAADATDDSEQRVSTNFAFGVYHSWYSLTVGWQNIGDNERLENLTKIVNYKSHGN